MSRGGGGVGETGWEGGGGCPAYQCWSCVLFRYGRTIFFLEVVVQLLCSSDSFYASDCDQQVFLARLPRIYILSPRYNMAPINKLGEIMYRTSLVTRPETVPPDDRVTARSDCTNLVEINKIWLVSLLRVEADISVNGHFDKRTFW